MLETLKSVQWMGSVLKNLRDFPAEVRDSVGYAVYCIQQGSIPPNTKMLKGLKPAVMEITVDHNTDTYRVIYTVKIGKKVYVLHCFQKKSKRSIETPKYEIDLIRKRLREAEQLENN